MRIVSQDGKRDFNYDCINLEVIGNEINAYEMNGDNWILAVYQTEEKAKEEMRRLHTLYEKMLVQREKTGLIHYTDLPKVFQFANSEG